MIKLRGIKKAFPGLPPIFKGINLDVEYGESVVLIGPSGSGKSTLLRCINGLEDFQEGLIDIDGLILRPKKKKTRSAEEREILRQIRLKVGMVFQHFNLFPHMNAYQNIIEGPSQVLKIDKAACAEQAEMLLKRVNMEHKRNSYPHMLSGGEQQRVAIARALAMVPEAMLFDEPTSALDPEMTGEVREVIRDLVNEGMTSVISTHEMDFAYDVADRIVVLDKGEIVEEGTPENIFSKPKAERTRMFINRILQGVSFLKHAPMA